MGLAAPSRISASSAKRSRSSAMKTAEFSASRTALVAIASHLLGAELLVDGDVLGHSLADVLDCLG